MPDRTAARVAEDVAVLKLARRFKDAGRWHFQQSPIAHEILGFRTFAGNVGGGAVSRASHPLQQTEKQFMAGVVEFARYLAQWMQRQRRIRRLSEPEIRQLAAYLHAEWRRRTVTWKFPSVAETARLLGCSEKVVRAELRRGRLPEYRVGRLVRIRIADLERLRVAR